MITRYERHVLQDPSHHAWPRICAVASPRAFGILAHWVWLWKMLQNARFIGQSGLFHWHVRFFLAAAAMLTLLLSHKVLIIACGILVFLCNCKKGGVLTKRVSKSIFVRKKRTTNLQQHVSGIPIELLNCKKKKKITGQEFASNAYNLSVSLKFYV